MDINSKYIRENEPSSVIDEFNNNYIIKLLNVNSDNRDISQYSSPNNYSIDFTSLFHIKNLLEINMYEFLLPRKLYTQTTYTNNNIFNFLANNVVVENQIYNVNGNKISIYTKNGNDIKYSLNFNDKEIYHYDGNIINKIIEYTPNINYIEVNTNNDYQIYTTNGNSNLVALNTKTIFENIILAIPCYKDNFLIKNYTSFIKKINIKFYDETYTEVITYIDRNIIGNDTINKSDLKHKNNYILHPLYKPIQNTCLLKLKMSDYNMYV